MAGLPLRDLTGEINLTEHWPSARGGFADVYVGIWGAANSKVGVKVLRAMDESSSLSKISKRIHRELNIWQNMQHPNVLPLFGIAHGYGPYPAMVCPWQENGNLNLYLEQHNTQMTLLERFHIIAGVATGLLYLHSISVVHGDLTGSNVLISDTGEAYLSDFGLSVVVAEMHRSSNFTSTVGGALRWADPYLYPEIDAAAAVPDPIANIYSDTLSGKIPYYNLSNTQVLFQLIRGRKPQQPSNVHFDDRHWDLIQCCWRSPPPDRPNMIFIKARVLEFLSEIKRVELLVSKMQMDNHVDGLIEASPDYSEESAEVSHRQMKKHIDVLALYNPEDLDEFIEEDVLYFRAAKLTPSSIDSATLDISWVDEDYSDLEGHVWDLSSGVIGHTTHNDKSLVFARLPSSRDNTQPVRWSIDDLGFRVREFALHPVHDLLVVLEEVTVGNKIQTLVHLRSLITGMRHPSASISPLSLSQYPGWALLDIHYTIQMSGPYLGIMQHQDAEWGHSEFLAFNWMSGSVHLHLYEYNLHTFAFLTDVTVILGLKSQLAKAATLEVFDLTHPRSASMRVRDATRICGFKLPAFLRDLSFTIHTEAGGTSLPSLPTLLADCQLERMFGIHFKPVSPSSDEHFTMFVPLPTLLVKLVNIRNPPFVAPVLDWETWGPRGTHMLPLSMPATWDVCIRGMECILPVRQPAETISRSNGSALEYMLVSIEQKRSLAVAESAPEEASATTGVTEPNASEHVLKHRIRKVALPQQVRDLAEGILISGDDIVVVANKSDKL